MPSVFWEDLSRDLDDPGFLRDYVTESVRIATTDTIINALDDARIASGMSKAEIARAIGAEPGTVRRLFASRNANPTLGTLAEVAAALGMRITVEPLPAAERNALTNPLRSGKPSRTTRQRLAKMRDRQRRAAA